jgi:hypothetical protein
MAFGLNTEDQWIDY